MSDIPQLSYRQTIKRLRKFGFSFKRSTGGSHEIWWNEKTQKTCVVPHHREVKKGTMKSILQQTGISQKDFFAN